jgi:hypothetical protein
MQEITAKQWVNRTPAILAAMEGKNAYLWEETGNGSLRPVTGISRDWWIYAGGCSWCCTPDTTLYLFDSEEERRRIEEQMKRRLVNRRWSSNAIAF